MLLLGSLVFGVITSWQRLVGTVGDYVGMKGAGVEEQKGHGCDPLEGLCRGRLVLPDSVRVEGAGLPG